MKERSFDEMITYFNSRVSEMDITQDYKMELLGMVTALGYKHEKTAQQWIPCTERLPEEGKEYLVTAWYDEMGRFIVTTDYFFSYGWDDWKKDVVAWAELPEPYREGKQNG